MHRWLPFGIVGLITGCAAGIFYRLHAAPAPSVDECERGGYAVGALQSSNAPRSPLQQKGKSSLLNGLANAVGAKSAQTTAQRYVGRAPVDVPFSSIEPKNVDDLAWGKDVLDRAFQSSLGKGINKLEIGASCALQTGFRLPKQYSDYRLDVQLDVELDPKRGESAIEIAAARAVSEEPPFPGMADCYTKVLTGVAMPLLDEWKVLEGYQLVPRRYRVTNGFTILRR